MKNKIKQLTRLILLREFYKRELEEDVNQVIDDTPSKDIENGIVLAKKLNDEGENYKLTEKTLSKSKDLFLAFEILVDAYAKGDGYEYELPNGTSITVNKKSITSAMKKVFDPYVPGFNHLIGVSNANWEKVINSEKFKYVIDSINGKLKRVSARTEMQKLTGSEEIPEIGEVDRIDYLIQKYYRDYYGQERNDEYIKKKDNKASTKAFTFLTYLGNNIAKSVVAAIRNQRLDDKKSALSYDAVDADVTSKASNEYTAPSHKFEGLTHILGESSATIGNIIIQDNILSQRPDQEAYFKIILKLSLEFPNAAGSKLRNNELSKIYNETESGDYKDLVDVIFDVVKTKGKNTGKTNREIYDNNFDMMWKTESKDLKRGARTSILSNLNSIKNQAHEQGVVDADALTPALLAFLLESPKKANELYKNISLDTQRKLQANKNTDVILDPISNAANDVEQDNKPNDIFANAFGDDDDPFADFMQESDELLTESENDDPNISLNNIFQLIEKHHNASNETENLNEARKIIRKTILKSLLEK